MVKMTLCIMTVASEDRYGCHGDDNRGHSAWSDAHRGQARLIFSQGEEAVVFALLQLVKQLAEQKAASAADSH